MPTFGADRLLVSLQSSVHYTVFWHYKDNSPQPANRK